MLTRRAFHSTALGASLALLNRQAQARRLERFGLQLSTLTPLLMADFEATLETVASIGYREVEFSALGFLGRDVEHVARQLAANGLSAPIGRISPKLPGNFASLSGPEQMAAFRQFAGPEYLLDNVRHSLEQARFLGQKHLVLPALMADNFLSADAVRASIDLLRRAGEICAKEGVQFGYHNHDWEFRPVDGRVPFDDLLRLAEPELVAFQLDVYWVTKGGADPHAYLAEHPGRFPTIHLKDIDADGDFEDVGYGLIDFPRVVAEALASGSAYFFVERDRPFEPLKAARRSFDYLSNMTF